MSVTERSTRLSAWLQRVSIAAAVLAVTALMVYIVAVNVIQRGQIITLQDDLQNSQENATRLYEQLLDLGEDPVGEEP